jgi:hypothetical protein
VRVKEGFGHMFFERFSYGGRSVKHCSISVAYASQKPSMSVTFDIPNLLSQSQGNDQMYVSACILHHHSSALPTVVAAEFVTHTVPVRHPTGSPCPTSNRLVNAVKYTLVLSL